MIVAKIVKRFTELDHFSLLIPPSPVQCCVNVKCTSNYKAIAIKHGNVLSTKHIIIWGGGKEVIGIAKSSLIKRTLDAS